MLIFNGPAAAGAIIGGSIEIVLAVVIMAQSRQDEQTTLA